MTKPWEAYNEEPEAVQKPWTKYAPPLDKIDASSWTGELPSIAGGLAGGVAKTILGRTGLSSLLAAGGEAYHQIYQAATDSPLAPQTTEEAIKRMAVPAGEQALGGVIGEGIVRGASKIIPKVIPEFRVPGLDESETALRPYMEKYLPKGMISKKDGGPAFTISQKSDPASSAAKMENIVESSFFGSTPIKRFKFAQENAIQDYAVAVTDKLWKGINSLPPSVRGEEFIKAFDTANDAFKATAKGLYKRVDDTIGNELVDTSLIKKWAANLDIKNKNMAGIGSSEAGDTIVSKVGKLPDKMTFSDASELRSRLLAEERSLIGNDKAKGISGKFASLIDESMSNAASNLSNDAMTAWRDANLFYKTGKEKFNNEFMSRLIRQGKEQPEIIGKAIFQNGEITQIRKAKEILKNDPLTWQAMKAGYWESVLSKATNQEGVISGKALFNNLKTMGDETMKEIFTPKERLLIDTFKKSSLATQSKSAGGGGSMLIQLMQAPALGAGITLWGGFQQDPEIILGGLAVLSTPRILGKMMVSPKYQKLFFDGLSTSRPIATPAITKLALGALEMVRDKKQNTTVGMGVKR